MKDTAPDVEQIQRDIIHSKTDHERAMMGIDMIESTRKIVLNSIKIENSDLTEREVIAELFERYYGHEFSQDEIEIIKKGIIEYKEDRQV
jgi:hypothetical protein